MSSQGEIVQVEDIKVMRGCACGPHRCVNCTQQIAASRCVPIPFYIRSCPHCGYPTHSRKI